ncbi:MAG TPA: Ku protein [Terriglobales bacterium]|nr:Ku protein [Terriglobales bacterium]
MARAFWKGSISFGLVEIPVSLRPAAQRNDMSFSLLDKRDFAPVGYRHYNKATGKEVSWGEIVRGYEYEVDQYVVLTDEELASANVKATQTIEIQQFVAREQIPPIFFDTPYFVEPLKKNSKSYNLLREVLERAKKVGIAKVVLRTRQHLAALLVRDGILMLDLLRYPDELRKPEDLAVPDKNAKESRLSPAELKMAERLVAGMSGDWDPSEYRDEYRSDVLKLIERKVKEGRTHEIVQPTGEAEPRVRQDVVDLMPLLKRSLDRSGRQAPGHGRSPAARARARSRTPARARAGARRHERSA